MRDVERAAIAVAFLEYLDKNFKKKCNEVALQRSVYLLQELVHIPLGLHFMLYKHTVYSFDLAEEVGSMINTIFKLQPKDDGALFLPNDRSGYVESLKETYRGLITQYKPHVEFLAESIASKSVEQLDLLATALYINLQNGQPTTGEREGIERIRTLKKIDEKAAREAIHSVKDLIRQTAHFNGHNKDSQ